MLTASSGDKSGDDSPTSGLGRNYLFFAHVCICRGLDVGEIDESVSLWVLRASNMSERIKALQAYCGSYRLSIAELVGCNG